MTCHNRFARCNSEKSHDVSLSSSFFVGNKMGKNFSCVLQAGAMQVGAWPAPLPLRQGIPSDVFGSPPR